MKFTKIIALFVAVITLLAMFTACNDQPQETTGGADIPQESMTRYKALVHVKVVNYNGKEVYSTDEEEPYEYDSAYYEPYVFTFLEDFAFMNDKEFAYKAKKYETGTDENGEKITTYVLESISITKKKKETTYKSGEEIVSLYDGSNQTTYWVCIINGEEIENMNETIIMDGDTVEFRLAYKDSHKVTTKVETLPSLD